MSFLFGVLVGIAITLIAGGILIMIDLEDRRRSI